MTVTQGRASSMSRPAQADSLTAVATAVLCALAAPAASEEPSGRGPLKIESFDFAAAGLQPPRAHTEPKPSWRTSFGSERRSVAPAAVAADPSAIDADVVLLQGVSTVRAVRRIFAAHDWRLVFSRQILLSDDPLDPWSRDAVAEVPTTAVAVRYHEGMRVTGQEHLLRLIGALPTGDRAEPPSAAGTAVRITDRGRTLWVVSVALAATCSKDASQCPARAALDTWRNAKHDSGEAVVVGGALETDASRPLPPPPCASQAIEAEGLTPAPATRRAAGQTALGKGCVATLVLAE